VIPQSLLSGDNAAFLDEQYRHWLDDPASVDPTLRALFDDLDAPPNGRTGMGPSFAPRSIFAGAGRAAAGGDVRQAKVVQLINAYRVRAHLSANIDPLGTREKVVHDELELKYYGLSDADLDAEFDTAPAYGLPPRAKLRTIVEHLRKAYCGSIGAEFMNIMDNTQKFWVQEQLETLPNRAVLTPEEERRVFRKLCDAENFERLLHTRFPGTKRFSLEGGETLIPLLDLLLERAGQRGVREIVMGMAHRGRLNTLVNIFEKPALHVVREFQDVKGETQGSGDVKYHLGYSSDTTTVNGDQVHLSVTPNPSHLEAVNAVVEGRLRAKQDRDGADAIKRSMAVLLHGDAAFAGQGSVTEVLNLSELKGYRTGGTLHVIVNNQIGFTTAPAEGRSTEYATDVARMLAVPIFHVNGEDPRAVAAVIQMAVDFRQTFHRDVIVDMYCYRKHGHNEGDEPSFTQPQMYKNIRSRPTPREVYAKHLVRIGTLTEAECQAIYDASFDDMQAEAAEPEVEETTMSRAPLVTKGDDPDLSAYGAPGEVTQEVERPSSARISPLKSLWEVYSSGSVDDVVETGVPLDRLVPLLKKANSVPKGLKAHAKIKRLLKQRQEIVAGERPVDWAIGEQAAWASLLDEGFAVRISGQDSGRGTFSHRHAVITDIETGEEYYPLDHINENARFDAIDSSLSELAVLGFEVGYALDTPDGLVMWEAQFGDFANGAQMIVDQFLAATEQKWNRQCGLVMLLPHGYEGQGPEHSSARMERYLTMCAELNMQVANCTTPASFFHLLRRQVVRKVRKPLIVMTPKSGLRHPLATSTLDELATGHFEPVLDEIDPIDPGKVERVVLCSGKVYYELLAARRERDEQRIAIVRLEQLYPFPRNELMEIYARYGEAEIVWCQEEPRNMGAWPRALHWFLDELPAQRLPRYVGRPEAASPATGSHRKHVREQSALVEEALSLPEE
jgi:2-oxoglutarate dehydrogenase E1 component